MKTVNIKITYNKVKAYNYAMEWENTLISKNHISDRG